MPVERHNPETLPDTSRMGYTQVTTASPGRLVFMSGQVAWRRDGTPVPEGLAAQAEIAIDNVRKGLTAIGAGPEHVTAMRIYVVGLTAENAADATRRLPPFSADRRRASP